MIFVSLLTGRKLYTVGAFFPCTFINGERLLKSARGGERAPKYHCVLNGDACALAQKRRHRVRGIAQHGDAPLRILLEWFAVTKPPFE